MAKYFVLLLVMTLMLLSFSVSCATMGFADFVAVADRSGSVIVNPAGLANLSASDLDWEHRFTDRDEGRMDFDDLLIYTASGSPGFGALFYGYSQDLVSSANPGLYWRTSSYGYAYGWRVSEQVNLGVTLKGVNLSSFDAGTQMQQPYDAGVFFDFGLQMKVNEQLKLGLAVHNIGRNMANPYFNYETAAGVAYRINRLLVAAEIDDYLNEGGNPTYRLGGRYTISEAIQPWAYLHIAEDGNLGGALGLEYQSGEHLNVEVSWFSYHNGVQNIDSIKTSVGYRF